MNLKMDFVTSTELGLVHRDEALDLTEVSHQVDVLGVGLAAHGLQRVHIHPADANGKDLDACLPGPSGNLLHFVLRSAVCHDHSNSRDAEVLGPRSVFLSEGPFHGVLDGQSSHCSCGEVRHLPHRLLHLRLGGEGFE